MPRPPQSFFDAVLYFPNRRSRAVARSRRFDRIVARRYRFLRGTLPKARRDRWEEGFYMRDVEEARETRS